MSVMAAVTTPAAGGVPPRPLRVQRYRPTVGPAYWRWQCRWCGERGGGRHHADAIGRAARHCAEHPDHPSALLPPVRCRPVPPAEHHPALAAAAEPDPGSADRSEF